MTIHDFVECHSLNLMITRIHGKKVPWMTGIPNSWIKENLDDPFLRGISGWGRDPEFSLLDYAKKVSGKILVFDSCSDQREEIQIPSLDFYGYDYYPKEKWKERESRFLSFFTNEAIIREMVRRKLSMRDQ